MRDDNCSKESMRETTWLRWLSLEANTMRDMGTLRGECYERCLTGYDFEKHAGACWDDSYGRSTV